MFMQNILKKKYLFWPVSKSDHTLVNIKKYNELVFWGMHFDP